MGLLGTAKNEEDYFGISEDGCSGVLWRLVYGSAERRLCGGGESFRRDKIYRASEARRRCLLFWVIAKLTRTGGLRKLRTEHNGGVMARLREKRLVYRTMFGSTSNGAVVH